MDQAQWATLVAVLRAVARSLPRGRRRVYSDFLIAKLYFWAVSHDRPMTWAVDPLHYNRLFRPRKLPSVSQLNRRIAGERFRTLLSRVHERLGRGPMPGTLYVDGKPLNVSPVSGDRDAKAGYAGRGYKLHAVVTDACKIVVFCVLPLDRHEMPVARVMLEHLSPLAPGTLVMADGNYDAHALHKDVHARGGWLVTRPRTGGARRRVGRGHAVTRRQMGPARRRLIDL